MRSVHESNVTAEPRADQRAAGVWTLTNSGPIIDEPGGPATLLVPSEQVLLLAVDLPLSSRAKRIEALPFAIEDRIAEPLESVHLAIGAEISPRRYLVAVVRHDVMARWIDAADSAGLGHAAMVPDALALPVPTVEKGWTLEVDRGRALVRAFDGTGFAAPESMLRAIWEAGEAPQVVAYNGSTTDAVPLSGLTVDSKSLGERLRSPAVDLRQGRYARRATVSNAWRRAAWIVGIGAVAHAGIALADTVALRIIADRREADTLSLVAQVAPGTSLQGDLATSIAAMLPTGPGGVPQTFVPLVSRISGALAPLGAINARAVTFQSETLVLDLDAQPGLAARIRGALEGARIKGNVTESPDGSIRVTAGAA